MFSLKSFIFFCAFIAIACAACTPFKNPGKLKLYTQTGKKGVSTTYSSANKCTNTSGGPWVAGNSLGNYVCTGYTGVGCSGSFFSIDSSGWNAFCLRPIKSFSCPCY